MAHSYNTRDKKLAKIGRYQGRKSSSSDENTLTWTSFHGIVEALEIEPVAPRRTGWT